MIMPLVMYAASIGLSYDPDSGNGGNGAIGCNWQNIDNTTTVQIRVYMEDSASTAGGPNAPICIDPMRVGGEQPVVQRAFLLQYPSPTLQDRGFFTYAGPFGASTLLRGVTLARIAATGVPDGQLWTALRHQRKPPSLLHTA